MINITYTHRYQVHINVSVIRFFQSIVRLFHVVIEWSSLSKYRVWLYMCEGCPKIPWTVLMTLLVFNLTLSNLYTMSNIPLFTRTRNFKCVLYIMFVHVVQQSPTPLMWNYILNLHFTWMSIGTPLKIPLPLQFDADISLIFSYE